MEMVTHPNRTKRSGERAVLVTTAHRGVFFGYAKKTNGATIALRRARNCIYWPVANKGFLGLASMGPVDPIQPSCDFLCHIAEQDMEAAYELRERKRMDRLDEAEEYLNVTKGY